MQSIQYPFTTPANFTYDAAKIEVSDGVAKLLDRRDSNATAYASYTNNINLNWGNGVLIGVAFGGAAISGGELDLSLNDSRHAQYNPIGNANHKQIGTIRFKIRPNYSGNPDIQQPFYFEGIDSSLINAIYIYQVTSGQIYAAIYNSSGVLIDALGYNASLVSGNQYEIEVGYNATTGNYYIFENGVLKDSKSGNTGTRGNTQLIRVGQNSSASLSGNKFKFDDFIIFNTVQHTAGYTPASYGSETIYVTDSPSIKPAVAISTFGIKSINSSINVQGSDSIKEIQNIDGQDKYHNGSSWVDSNGFLAQSNTEQEVNNNLSTLNLSSGVSYLPVWLLTSNDGSTTPEIDLSTINYLTTNAVTATEVFDFMGTPTDVRTNQNTAITTLIAEQQALLERNLGRVLQKEDFTNALFHHGHNCEIYENKLFLKGKYRDIFSITSISDDLTPISAVTNPNDDGYYHDISKGIIYRINNRWIMRDLSVKISGSLGLVETTSPYNTKEDLKMVLIEMVAAKSGLWKNNVETADGTISTITTQISADSKRIIERYKNRDI